MKTVVVTAALLFSSAIHTVLLAQVKSAITPSDCVTVKYVGQEFAHGSVLQINPQHTLVAYLLRVPDLATNSNALQIYVRSLTGDLQTPARLVMASDAISHLQWSADGRHILLLARNKTHIALMQVNVESGSMRVIAEGQGDVTDYSVDNNADVITYAVQSSAIPTRVTSTKLSKEDLIEGYRIPFEPNPLIPASKASASIFVERKVGAGRWTAANQIQVPAPNETQMLSEFLYGSLRLSLSPNGQQLLVQYEWLGEIPDAWKDSPYLRLRKSIGAVPRVMFLHNLVTGANSMPLKSTFTSCLPLWANDSKSFVAIAQAPLGTEVERADMVGGQHLYWVEIRTGRVEKIVNHVADQWEQPLFWQADGTLFVRVQDDLIAKFNRSHNEWRKTGEIRLPVAKPSLTGVEATTDGEQFVIAYMDTTTPPELLLFEPGWSSVKVLEKLNPIFDQRTIANAEPVHWTTSTGYGVDGLLLKPIGYVNDARYPLVIQTKEDIGSFLCDSGVEHMPSFAPQPLANSGVMYLLRTIPENFNDEGQRTQYSQGGYPGDIGEAAFYTDLWDRAVESLDRRGLIDPRKVGIIGFSKSGWYVQFALAHGRTRYRAATTADNVMFSEGEYWQDLNKDRGSMDVEDRMYGGPPFGKTLANWLKYSVSFNLDKFHTPLMMEYNGYGQASPTTQSARIFELFSELNHLGKPVELYYYPLESHLPDHPQARLASLQRNLDWYRFWLQGYEDPDPVKKQQYKRWEHLRELQNAEDAKATTDQAQTGSVN